MLACRKICIGAFTPGQNGGSVALITHTHFRRSSDWLNLNAFTRYLYIYAVYFLFLQKEKQSAYNDITWRVRVIPLTMEMQKCVPIVSLSILSPEQYWVKSTDH
jgi:hypothetical protein